MDKGCKSPRKLDRQHRKQKKRKKNSSRRRPHKPDPGKSSTSPEGDPLSDNEGSGLSVTGQHAGVYTSTLNFDPRTHLASIQQAPKPLSDALERLSRPARPINKPQQPPTTTTTSSYNLKSSASFESVRRYPASGSTKPQRSPSKTDANESLRWEHSLSDEEKERERIRLYKINRRKRYLAASNVDSKDWALASASCSSMGSNLEHGNVNHHKSGHVGGSNNNLLIPSHSGSKDRLTPSNSGHALNLSHSESRLGTHERETHVEKVTSTVKEMAISDNLASHSVGRIAINV